MVVNNWDVLVHDPILFEILGEELTLLDTHLSHTGGSVSQISNEDWLEMLNEDILSEDNG